MTITRCHNGEGINARKPKKDPVEQTSLMNVTGMAIDCEPKVTKFKANILQYEKMPGVTYTGSTSQ